jgi:hypothetical protein
VVGSSIGAISCQTLWRAEFCLVDGPIIGSFSDEPQSTEHRAQSTEHRVHREKNKIYDLCIISKCIFISALWVLYCGRKIYRYRIYEYMHLTALLYTNEILPQVGAF